MFSKTKLGEEIRFHRVTNNILQKDLAIALEITAKRVSDIEHGRGNAPLSVDELKRIIYRLAEEQKEKRLKTHPEFYLGVQGVRMWRGRETGKKVMEDRHRLGLDQRELALKLGVSQALVCGWESGRKGISEAFMGLISVLVMKDNLEKPSEIARAA